MARKKLIESILSLGAVQLASHLLVFLTLPYLASKLGIEGLGRMAFALSVAQVLVILTDYGFNLSASKDVVIHRDDPVRLAEIWCAVTWLRSLFAVVGLAAILMLGGMLPRFRAELPLLLIAYLLVVGNVLFPQWLFQGLEQLRAVSLIQVLCRMVAVLGIFVTVRGPGDTAWAVLFQSVGTLLGGLLVVPHVRRVLAGGRLAWPTRVQLRTQLHQGWHVFLSTASINLYTSSNAFFLGLLTTPVEVGYYHVAEKMIKAVLTLYGPVGSAVYPHVSRLAAADTGAVMRFNRRLLIVVMLAGTAVVVLVHGLAAWGVEQMFGRTYAAAVPVLEVFAWMPVFSMAAHVMGILTMLPMSMNVAFSRVLMFAVVVDFVLFIPLVKYLGALGAAGTNVCVEFFVAATCFVLLHRAGLNPLTRPRVAAA